MKCKICYKQVKNESNSTIKQLICDGTAVLMPAIFGHPLHDNIIWKFVCQEPRQAAVSVGRSTFHLFFAVWYSIQISCVLGQNCQGWSCQTQDKCAIYKWGSAMASRGLNDV